MSNNADSPSRHPIKLVARRTGLTTAVIRAWERRYEAIRPSRSPGHRRLYSDEEVERLRLLRQVTLAGRRIGSVAKLPTSGLRTLAEEDLAAAARVPEPADESGSVPHARPHVEAGLRAVACFDPPAMEAALRIAAAELNTMDLMEQVIVPFLHALGRRWRDGSLEVSQEHLATALVRSLLEGLRTANPRMPAGPAIVVTTPSGQAHDLGALMVAVTAAASRWRVAYLGPELPAPEIAGAVVRSEASAVALSLVHPDNDPGVADQLAELRRLLPRELPMLIGGRAAPSYRSVLGRIGARVHDNLQTLRVELDRLREQSA